MTSKQIIMALADRLQVPDQQVEQMLTATVSQISTQLADGGTVHLQDFGDFEVRKRAERLTIHPITKKRTLTPPKLSCTFKQSPALKNKINSK